MTNEEEKEREIYCRRKEIKRKNAKEDERWNIGKRRKKKLLRRKGEEKKDTEEKRGEERG